MDLLTTSELNDSQIDNNYLFNQKVLYSKKSEFFIEL